MAASAKILGDFRATVEQRANPRLGKVRNVRTIGGFAANVQAFFRAKWKDKIDSLLDIKSKEYDYLSVV